MDFEFIENTTKQASQFFPSVGDMFKQMDDSILNQKLFKSGVFLFLQKDTWLAFLASPFSIFMRCIFSFLLFLKLSYLSVSSEQETASKQVLFIYDFFLFLVFCITTYFPVVLDMVSQRKRQSILTLLFDYLTNNYHAFRDQRHSPTHSVMSWFRESALECSWKNSSMMLVGHTLMMVVATLCHYLYFSTLCGTSFLHQLAYLFGVELVCIGVFALYFIHSYSVLYFQAFFAIHWVQTLLLYFPHEHMDTKVSLFLVCVAGKFCLAFYQYVYWVHLTVFPPQNSPLKALLFPFNPSDQSVQKEHMNVLHQMIAQQKPQQEIVAWLETQLLDFPVHCQLEKNACSSKRLVQYSFCFIGVNLYLYYTSGLSFEVIFNSGISMVSFLFCLLICKEVSCYLSLLKEAHVLYFMTEFTLFQCFIFYAFPKSSALIPWVFWIHSTQLQVEVLKRMALIWMPTYLYCCFFEIQSPVPKSNIHPTSSFTSSLFLFLIQRPVLGVCVVSYFQITWTFVFQCLLTALIVYYLYWFISQMKEVVKQEKEEEELQNMPTLNDSEVFGD